MQPGGALALSLPRSAGVTGVDERPQQATGPRDGVALLLLSAERAGVAARVERLAAVPAEAALGDLAGTEAPADVLHLGRVVVDLGRGREIVEQFRGARVALRDLG